MNAEQKIRQILADEFRGAALRSIVPDFIDLLEVMLNDVQRERKERELRDLKFTTDTEVKALEKQFSAAFKEVQSKIDEVKAQSALDRAATDRMAFFERVRRLVK